MESISKENVLEPKEIIALMRNDQAIQAILKKYGKGKQADKKIREYIKGAYVPLMTPSNGFVRRTLTRFLFGEKRLDFLRCPDEMDRSTVLFCKIGTTLFFFSDKGCPLLKAEEGPPMNGRAKNRR